jgi:hypothetical protein
MYMQVNNTPIRKSEKNSNTKKKKKTFIREFLLKQ